MTIDLNNLNSMTRPELLGARDKAWDEYLQARADSVGFGDECYDQTDNQLDALTGYCHAVHKVVCAAVHLQEVTLRSIEGGEIIRD